MDETFSRLIFILLAVAVVGGAIWGGVNGPGKFLVGVFSVTGLEQSKYIEVPTFGYLECSAAESETISRSFGAEMQTITCAQDNIGPLLGINNGCVVTLIAPDKTTLIKRSYSYYYFLEGKTETKRGVVDGGILGYHNEKLQIPMGPNDMLQVMYGEAPFGQSIFLAEGQSYSVQGVPYHITIHDERDPNNGGALAGARMGNCYLENAYYKARQIQYADPGITELNGKQSQLDFNSLNRANGKYTYMSGFMPVPSFDQSIETVDGQAAYCMNDRIYKTLKIKVNGFDYTIVNYDKAGFIKSVTCCNGEDKPGYVCVDHTWVPQAEATCNESKGLFCPQSNFQEYDAKQYRRMYCDAGECKPEIITTKCAYDTDCGSGEACVRDADPTKNYCVQAGSGGQPLPPSGDETDWTPWIILGCAAAIGLGMYYYKKKQEEA